MSDQQGIPEWIVTLIGKQALEAEMLRRELDRLVQQPPADHGDSQASQTGRETR